MPTYVYRREDGSTFEVQQRITEEALEVDPATGQKVRRVISGAGLIFKGEGFYVTDYARKETSTNESGSNGSDSGKSEKADSGKSEPKVEKKAESKSSD